MSFLILPDTLLQHCARVKTVLPSLVACVCMGVLLVACDDPANVGGDLLGAPGGEPLNTVEPLSSLRPTEWTPSDRPARVLTGMVDDPALGRYEVQGYFDVTALSSDDFRAGVVESVELRLRRTYVYGDSTSEMRAALRQIDENWNADDLSLGASFATGSIITEFTFLATDTLVVVPLPDSWVSEHDATLRNANLGDLLHGFRIDPVAGNAVVGFGPQGSSLFASTGSDSLSHPIGKAYPFVAHTVPANIPEGRFLMQAGLGPNPEFSLSVSSDIHASGEPLSVNRATFMLWADTLTLQQNAPTHFERPMLRTLDLYTRAPEDTAYTVLGRSTMDEEGRFVFEGPGLARLIEDRIAEDMVFELRMPNPTSLPISLVEDHASYYYYYSSMNPVLLYDADADADRQAPSGFITLTPIY